MEQMWVKFVDGQIVDGPSPYKPDDSYVEYLEIVQLESPYNRVTVTVQMIDGKCVKTITSVSDYRVQRAQKYPAIGDQLDMIWHAMKDGVLPRVEPFYSEIEAIKAQYPKPNGQ